MADKLQPNDERDEKGNIVPKSAEAISKRLAKLRGTDDYGEVTGYKVVSPWVYSANPAEEPPHKKGETLAVADVHMPEGRDRKAHIAELVANGNLEPQYADAGARKRIAEAARLMTPTEHREFLMAEAERAGKVTTAAVTAVSEGVPPELAAPAAPAKPKSEPAPAAPATTAAPEGTK